MSVAEISKSRHAGARTGAGRPRNPTASESWAGWGGARANSGGARAGAGRPRNPLPTPPEPLGSRWFCALTHPGAEFRAELDLMAKGIEVYLPLHLDRRFERDVGQGHIVPLFRTYIFVNFGRGRGSDWRRIYRSQGIAGLIGDASD